MYVFEYGSNKNPNLMMNIPVLLGCEVDTSNPDDYIEISIKKWAVSRIHETKYIEEVSELKIS